MKNYKPGSVRVSRVSILDFHTRTNTPGIRIEDLDDQGWTYYVSPECDLDTDEDLLGYLLTTDDEVVTETFYLWKQRAMDDGPVVIFPDGTEWSLLECVEIEVKNGDSDCPLREHEDYYEKFNDYYEKFCEDYECERQDHFDDMRKERQLEDKSRQDH